MVHVPEENRTFCMGSRNFGNRLLKKVTHSTFKEGEEKEEYRSIGRGGKSRLKLVVWMVDSVPLAHIVPMKGQEDLIKNKSHL